MNSSCFKKSSTQHLYQASVVEIRKLYVQMQIVRVLECKLSVMAGFSSATMFNNPRGYNWLSCWGFLVNYLNDLSKFGALPGHASF